MLNLLMTSSNNNPNWKEPKFMKKSLKKLKGFTLVELLIVIAIIAILAMVITPTAFGAIEKSKATAALSDIRAIQSAELAYFVQEGKLPATVADMEITGAISTDYAYTGALDLTTLDSARTLTVDGLSAKAIGYLNDMMTDTTVNEALLITITP